ncbi:ATP-binding cassette domain-containing protein [Streptomyces tubercidicus]|uniref:ATP-binding cassette domain-containing protein n=1 Tax=Streptomyces tubercidicus TaxID=47759 RepID=UPI002E18323E|nr:ATP-binding cassette domain-containing protein [Streptomyces tubercidicus]
MNTTRQGAAVNASGIGVEGPRGWAFRGVAITAEPGTLIAVQGPSGSGRTCLLLALTGRMRITEGEATVAGLPLPKRMGSVRSRTALAHVPGVADLEPALTVGEHLKEQALLGHRIQGSLSASLPWGKRHKEATRARVDAALAAARLDPGTLPKGLRTTVRDLERIEALRLSVALGLMHGPQLLAVDDVDLKLAGAERTEVWQLLRDLAREGLTVVAAGDGAPEDALIVSTARTATEAADAKTDAAAQTDAGSATPPTDAESTGPAPAPAPTQDDDTPKEDTAHAFAKTGRA